MAGRRLSATALRAPSALRHAHEQTDHEDQQPEAGSLAAPRRLRPHDYGVTSIGLHDNGPSTIHR